MDILKPPPSAITSQLSTEQLKYLAIRQSVTSDAEAARQLGITSVAISRWPDIVKQALREQLLSNVQIASEIIARNAVKAAETKVTGLDSTNDWVKQQAASDILDRAGVRAKDLPGITVNVQVDNIDKLLMMIYGGNDGTNEP